MEERRAISRVNFDVQGVVVVCDTEEKIYVQVRNFSPMGMGVLFPADAPDLLNKEIIIVAKSVIMYATVIRTEERKEDGSYFAGISAKDFTPEVLQYLFEKSG